MPKARPVDKVVVEASAWIALLEDEPDRAEHVERLLSRAANGECQIYTSALTITEVTKVPKADDPPLSKEQTQTFAAFLENEYVTTVSVDPVVAEKARDLRRAHAGLRTADAIHMATGIVIGAGVLYSYDDRHLRLDGEADMEGMRVLQPPTQHQATLGFETRDQAPESNDEP